MANPGDNNDGHREMLRLVGELPEQLAAGPALLDAAGALPEHSARRVVISGMGGSAAAAGLAWGVFGSGPLSVHVNRGYRLPSHVGRDCLLVFSSYSGNTEETLEAYRHGRDFVPEAPCVVISSGGELLDRGRADGIPCIQLPGGLPPRASLGYGVGVLFGLLGRLGLADGMEAALTEAIAGLREGNERLGPARPQGSNPARELARRLRGRLPLLYAGGGLTEAVAWRIKAQINENAKALAYVGVLPELDHNEVVGWQMATPVREQAHVVALRDLEDHPRVQRRFEITREVLGDQARGWDTVESRGRSAVARAMSLVQFGDYLSVYLAEEHEIDPMGVQAIDRLKQRLSEPD